MLRPLLGALVGYVTIVIWTMACLSAIWVLGGPSFAFEPGTTRLTSAWAGVALLLGFVGAFLGGWIASIGGGESGRRAAMILAAAVLAVGVWSAVARTRPKPPEPPRSMARLKAWEVSRHAIQPRWYAFLTPIVGFLGVSLGGTMRRD